MTFGTPPQLPDLAGLAEERMLRGADRTADRLIAYDLVLRMEGLHASATALSEEEAIRVFRKAVELAQRM